MAKKRGRKKRPIDWDLVGKMIMAGSNGAQVAASISIDYSTLVRRCMEDLNTNFTDFLNEKREAGNTLILNKQFDTAIKGNVPMLIWLGKQRLDQTDKRESKKTIIKEHDIDDEELDNKIQTLLDRR